MHGPGTRLVEPGGEVVSADASTRKWSKKTLYEVHELIGQGKNFEEAIAGRVDIAAAEDIAAFKADLERFSGGPLRADLDALLMTGGHVEVIRSALDVLHVGDGNSKWLTMLACVAAESDERIHPFPCAATRMGKTHMLESMEPLFRERFKRYDGSSPKNLYYEADRDGKGFLRGKVAYFDEIADREDLWPILKKVTDSNSDRLEHHTVLEKKAKTLELEGLPAVLTAGMKDVTDDQINGRFMKLPIDETLKQTSDIWDFSAEAARELRRKSENPVVVRARELLSIVMEGGPYRVLVPLAPCVDWAKFEFEQPRVDQRNFLGIVKATALLDRHRRPAFIDDGHPVVVASESDLNEAYRRWRAIGPTAYIKLDSMAFEVLKAIPRVGKSGPWKPTADIKTKLEGKVAPSTVHKKLDALFERGLVDRESAGRYNEWLWDRVVSDDRLEGMTVSTESLASFYGIPWKADFKGPTGRKQEVEEWAVSTLSTVSTGFEKTQAAGLAERMMDGQKPAGGAEER